MSRQNAVTDFHIHFCETSRLEEFLSFCEEAKIARAGLVSLPHKSWGNFNDSILKAVNHSPERFFGFGCLDHRLSRTEKGGAAQVKQLKADGFGGLKIWLGKPQIQAEFGIKIEDDYISGALKAAGNLGMSVLLHIADPPEFWNEGGILHNHDNFLNWIDRGRELFNKHPNTLFVGAHFLFLAGGLSGLAEILDYHSNLLLDTAPGRWFYRPLAENKIEASAFIHRHANRLLYGSDVMFFPKKFKTFPYIGKSENHIIVNRILHFLCGSATDNDNFIDDPYPWKDYGTLNGKGKPHKLPCLTLDESVVNKITNSNTNRFFERS